jgi:hypothetical protein
MTASSKRQRSAPWRLALLTAWVAGCASSSAQRAGAPSPPAPGTTTPGELPACARPATALERPSDFPASLPLPAGTIIASEERRSGQRLILHTVVASELRAVAVFFERELPAAGYRQGSGESESDEAEAAFEGPGLKGRWVAHTLPQCPGALTLDILVGPP